jgi:hypothetical protein
MNVFDKGAQCGDPVIGDPKGSFKSARSSPLTKSGFIDSL